MSIYLDHTKKDRIIGEIQIGGSKSESNRLLLLRQLFPQIRIDNLSHSDDTSYLEQALQTTSSFIDIGHAGTAMRFLTAYFAVQEGRIVQLSGSQRMRERPIKPLVDALSQLGANIRYLSKIGYPPLEIKGKKLTKNRAIITGHISSQFISALLLIAPALPRGLQLTIEDRMTSKPYIMMTLELMRRIGIPSHWDSNTLIISSIKNTPAILISVEPDWSSASYFYSLAALHPDAKIELPNFKKESLQADSVLPEIYSSLGVQTIFHSKGISLISKGTTSVQQSIQFNLIDTPDIAQSVAATCLGLNLDCNLTGLHTLKIKETDRLKALKKELEKLGAYVKITNNSLFLKPPNKMKENTSIATYNDHRMAMAFAPLSVKVPLRIENPEIVSKSYPDFWKDWKKLLGHA